MKRRRYKRRGPSEQFLLLPFELLLSLPEQHMTVLIDICKRHNGRNNGMIGYGWRDANKAAGVSRGGHILDDLRKRDIIKLTRDAGFDMKTGRRTREWEVPLLNPDNPASKGKRKLCLYHWLLNSAAFGELVPGEKKLLLELMRRYDGGNNGDIEFGVDSGALVQLGRTRTSRALSKLERLGFIETAAADPQHARLRRWRLTMYAAAGRPATKEFMRWQPSIENSFRGCSGATETPVSVALVQPNTLTERPSSRSAISQMHEKINSANELDGLDRQSPGSSRATQNALYGFTGAAHIEASQGLPRTQSESVWEKAPAASSAAKPSGRQTSAAPTSQRFLFLSSNAKERIGVKATNERKVAQSKKLRPSRSADARQGDLFPDLGGTTI